MATVYNVLDTRDKQELTDKIDADKNELSKTIQNTKTELQSNIDALESQHGEDKTDLQTQIDSLESIKADKTEITAHNTSNTAHNDIRLLIQNLTTKLNTIADSDDSTLDQMSEIVEYIKNNKELIDSITTTKVSVSDIINNLVTNVANKPLSAAMGVELKALIDAIPDTTLATVNEKILEHNVSADAHEDIRNDIVSVQSDATAAQTMADAAQALANNAQDDADEALQRLNSLEVGSGKIDRIVDGGGILTCEDPLIGAPLIKTGVRGRTVNNLWPVINSSSNGVTVSTDDTGLITVSGTSAGSSTMGGAELRIVSGRQYTLLVSAKAAGVRLLVNRMVDGELDGRLIDVDLSTTTTTTTTTVPADSAVYTAYLYVADGTTVNASFRVMLVEGTEAPDCFTPTGVHGVEAEKLMVAGRNLVNLDGAEYVKTPSSSSSSSATFGADGSVTITGATDSWNGCYVELKSVVLPSGSYVASGFPNENMWLLLTSPNVLNQKTAGDYYAGAGYPFRVDVGASQSAAFEIDAPSRVAFSTGDQIAEGASLTLYPQIELGSTATAYEPPSVTEVALPETDPLMYIYDRGDEMVIAQDGSVSVERQTFHELFDGGNGIVINSYIPVDADGYQYVALNSTKDKPTNLTISMLAVISDRFATGKRKPGNVVLTTGSVSGDGRNYIAFLFCFEPGTFADADEARQWFAANPTNVWFAGMPEIEYLGTIDSPTLPAQTSHVWFTSNIPVSDFSVRYWLPNGELVEELYRTGATEEISDNEIISIWNGVTGDIIEATNADIEAIFE